MRRLTYEVNRRAEGTSVLNRRLGGGVNGAVTFARCGAGDYGRGRAGKQAQSARFVPEVQAAGRQPRSAADDRGG